METALLMPIILMIIFILFFMVLYLYNRGIMQGALYRGVHQNFYGNTVSNGELEEKCTGVILMDLKDSLIGVHDVSVQIEVTAREVKGQVSGELNVPDIIFWERILFENLWKYEMSYKEPRMQPGQVLLTGGQIKDMLDEEKTEGEDR